MPCFGGAFRHWLRGLGGLGDAGGCVVPFQRSSVRSEMRSCVWRMPISRSLKRPRGLGGVVVHSRLASIHLEAPESA